MEERTPERRRSSVVPGQLRDALTRKAHDLFSLCDKENKGFVSKKDMQRLHGELPLEPDQLEVVFDSLDTDNNGFLTLEEFTAGFGKFLGYDKEPRRMSCFFAPQGECSQSAESSSKDVEDQEDDEQFEDFLDSLGAPAPLKEEEYVKNTWVRLRQEDPTMLAHFETFLTKVTNSMKKNETECSTLGQAILQRKMEQDKHVERLYEEMENQMKIDKEQLLAEERQKEQKLREVLEEKEHLLQEVMTKHSELQRQLKNLNSNEAGTKEENARLLKELKKLDRRLHDSECAVQDTQRRLESLQHQSTDEKRRRARTALQVTENIAMEREDLVKQLEKLRTMNKELLDHKDEINLHANANLHAAAGEASSIQTTVVRRQHDPCKEPQDDPRRGSRLSDYIKTPAPTLEVYENLQEDCEVDESYFERGTTPPVFLGIEAALSQFQPNGSRATRNDTGKSKVRPRSRSCEFRATSTSCKGFVSDEDCSESGRGDSLTSLPTDSHIIVHPERVFKVIMVGDSAVGKTCFVNRFCKDTFFNVFRATIGVDFQVKSVSVDGRPVALQMWDTAGQERFRSITKQYYRKADGVIIMYDVCSEHSFCSVRSWASVLDSEGMNSNVAVMLLGNKVDLISSSCQREVNYSEGERLAHEMGAQFYETSAKSGQNVVTAMEHMASILKVREDEEMDKALRIGENALEVDSTRKRCC
ncbi:EF-hand calcium-binding domain-containing protein 4B-like isoform X2 [Ornithodoros turicata]|uniref:EF-hand calcium-binding domain-containing protein 4B-like isoform X2 n=1 Tax=Ornithodoros turicata TaxID=34597 RepID=UPI0031395964